MAYLAIEVSGPDVEIIGFARPIGLSSPLFGGRDKSVQRLHVPSPEAEIAEKRALRARRYRLQDRRLATLQRTARDGRAKTDGDLDKGASGSKTNADRQQHAPPRPCRPQKLALRVSFPLVTEQSGARWQFSKGVFVVQAT
jgi:hypothetical protein